MELKIIKFDVTKDSITELEDYLRSAFKSLVDSGAIDKFEFELTILLNQHTKTKFDKEASTSSVSDYSISFKYETSKNGTTVSNRFIDYVGHGLVGVFYINETSLFTCMEVVPKYTLDEYIASYITDRENDYNLKLNVEYLN